MQSRGEEKKWKYEHHYWNYSIPLIRDPVNGNNNYYKRFIKKYYNIWKENLKPEYNILPKAEDKKILMMPATNLTAQHSTALPVLNFSGVRGVTEHYWNRHTPQAKHMSCEY